MSVISLNQAMTKTKGALAGLVCLGWEEVRAYVSAAEASKCPAVLMVGPGARASMPIEIWGKMLRVAAESSSAEFVIHLDHGREMVEIQRALDSGFSSVMFDGSALPLKENIAKTLEMVHLAQRYQASTEGEIGFVGYQDGARSEGTNPAEAKAFVAETGVDLMAVSVGNTHLQTEGKASIDWQKLEALAQIGKPLVIHGGSGVASADRLRMAREFGVRKFNIGTEIRQVFGDALRIYLRDNPQQFDHLTIMKALHEPISQAAKGVLLELGDIS